MKSNKLKTTFICLVSILFLSACSSKEELRINDKLTSFSLNNNVYIHNTPKTVKSPISFNLGLGGYISKHIGIGIGTTVRPDIPNTKALELEKSIALHNISFASLIKEEFKRQIKQDTFYKDKFVPFGANYNLHLYVLKYYIDESMLSQKAQIKINMKIEIKDKNQQTIYEKLEENSIISNNFIYTKSEILNSKFILEKVLNQAIKNVVFKIIKQMKNS